MEAVDEIKTLIEATARLSEAFTGLARKLNRGRGKIVRTTAAYSKEELSVLHAKLWNLRSAVDALKGEVLLAKAPAALGLVEGNRQKRLHEWRHGEQVRKHWDHANGTAPRIKVLGPQIQR
jgi:hypothetical protein